jgi:uncharacterized Rmd1/YagE family protein
MFFFDCGVIVFWNLSEVEEKSIITELKSFEIKSYNENYECDDINYQESNKYEEDELDPKAYISRDHLVLCV